jgi:hypothetical protein
MNLAAQLGTPQRLVPPPFPRATEANHARHRWTELGLPHNDLSPQNILIAVGRHTDERWNSLSGLGLPSAVRVSQRPLSVRTDWDQAPQTPLEATSLLESMVRQLLAHEQVSAARRLLKAQPIAGTEGQSLRRLRVLLTEPVVQRRLPARPGGAADLHWLTQNAAAYRGRWVAIFGGNLIDADPSLEVLLRRLKRTSPGLNPLLHRL